MIVYVGLAVVALLVLRFVLRFAVPILLLLIVVGMLAGCAKPAPSVTVAGPSVPAQLLACKPEPTPPAATTQRQVAAYLLDLADAGDDCRGKLGAVRGILK